jgi:hypothetical protein
MTPMSLFLNLALSRTGSIPNLSISFVFDKYGQQKIPVDNPLLSHFCHYYQVPLPFVGSFFNRRKISTKENKIGSLGW